MVRRCLTATLGRAAATGRHVNTLYVIAVMTSFGCGIDVLCFRAIEPDATGTHAQTYPTKVACISSRDRFIAKAQRDTARPFKWALRCVPENVARPLRAPESK
jgi:hypothetical protein